MATLKEAASLTEQLEELASRLHSELTEGDVDFTEMVRLADQLGESADTLASTFAAIDAALGQRLTGGEREEGQEEEAEGGGEQRPRARRTESRERTTGTTDEEPTKDELLERAKEAGIAGRSSMSKEELEQAISAAQDVSRDELLERAREAGIAGRSSMSKEQLREALQSEEALSKEELLERAREAGIEGRSEMSKEELREALRSA